MTESLEKNLKVRIFIGYNIQRKVLLFITMYYYIKLRI